MKQTIFLVTPKESFLYEKHQKKLVPIDSLKVTRPEDDTLAFLSGVPLKIIVEPFPLLQRLDKPILFKRLQKKHFREDTLFTCSLKKEGNGFVFRGVSVSENAFTVETSSFFSKVFLLESLLPALLKKADELFCVHFQGPSKEGSFIAFKSGLPFALQSTNTPEIDWDAFRRYLEKHHHVTIDRYTSLSFNASLFEKILDLLPKKKTLNLSRRKRAFFQVPLLLTLFRFTKVSILPLLILLNLWQGYTYLSLSDETSRTRQFLAEATQKIKPLLEKAGGMSSVELRSIAKVWKEVRLGNPWKESFQKLEASLRPVWYLNEVIWENRGDEISLTFRTEALDEESPSKLKNLLKRSFQTFRSSIEVIESESSELETIIVHLTETKDDS